MKYTALILTHIDKNTNQPLLPHLKWLIKSNPLVDFRVVIGEDSPHGKKYNWKNSDQVLRKWWKEFSSTVNNENIAVLEWDTLVTCKLPEIPEEYYLVGAMKFNENPNLRGKWIPKMIKDPTWKEENWMWWNDVPKMDLREFERAVGLVSFGAMFMKRWVLDEVCLSRWDTIYSRSIQNELRFPTIVSISGYEVGEINLPFVSWTDVEVGNVEGIYHSVDNPIPLDKFEINDK
jgi:hypothetical protein